MSDRATSVFATAAQLIRSAASALFQAVDLMFNAGPRLAEIRHLASMSEATLRARGLTRESELNRIFGNR